MLQENFSLEDEIIDLEWAAQKGHKPPKGKKYRYKVDGVPFISDAETVTGKEILSKAGKLPPENFILRQKLKGNWITIPLDKVVDFTEPGVEKFKTLPNDQTEGEDNAKFLRRDFALLEEDEEFLISLGLPWEAVKIGNVNWVFIHKYVIATGYNESSVTLGFRMIAGYPTAQLDMVYFHPRLARVDGQPIGAISNLSLDGKTFQQWSRHRTATNPWRPGIDNLSTHYPLVEAWLLKEFEKRPHYATTA